MIAFQAFQEVGATEYPLTLLAPINSHHIPSRVYVSLPVVKFEMPACSTTLTFDVLNSRQDPDTAQPQVSRGPEAAVAAIRRTMVCRLHDSDYWKLGKGWHSYDTFSLLDIRDTMAERWQDSSPSTNTRSCFRMLMARSLVPGPSSAASAPV